MNGSSGSSSSKSSGKGSVSWPDVGTSKEDKLSPEQREKIERVKFISPRKEEGQSSIAPASFQATEQDDDDVAYAPSRQRLGLLRYILPNCLYDFICWLLCLREPDPVDPADQDFDNEVVAPREVEASVVPAGPPQPTYANPGEWVQKIALNWQQSNDTRRVSALKRGVNGVFYGCRAIFVIKCSFAKEAPQFFVQNKPYNLDTWENFPKEIQEFYQKRCEELAKKASTIETLFIRVQPNPAQPVHSLTSIETCNFKAGDQAARPEFTSSWEDERLRDPVTILNTYPVLEEAGVNTADLSS